MSLYKIVRPLIFRLDAEKAHNLVVNCLALINRLPLLKKGLCFLFKYQHPSLRQKLFGLDFASPLGLPAGADKQGLAVDAWRCFGFGFAEIGSITFNAQPGNPKPRLWRLISQKSICVYLGLNSHGAKTIAKRLVKKDNKYPLGASIARSTDIVREETVGDYLKSFRILAPVSDFVTLNVSCPNVQNFTCLQRSEFLKSLLQNIENENKQYKKPIFVKIGPDNSDEELAEICGLARQYRVSALICTNLTKVRTEKTKEISCPGGLSGKLVEDLSNQTIKSCYRLLKGSEVKIIGVGGIFTAEDAYRKIKLGASLVQIYTGFIYQGPGAIKKINQGLVDLLRRDGFTNISEAVGIDNK